MDLNDPKQAAKAAAEEAEALRAEIGKKKKEEAEAAKAQKVEAEESARLAAKRERYQQLLQKNPDPTRRVFQMHMKAIKVENTGTDPVGSLQLKVTLGGDYSEREEPGKVLFKRGNRGAIFKTSSAPKLQEGESHFYKNEFGAGIPVYWMGSYVDLEVQEFQIDVLQSATIKKAKKRASG